MDRDAAPRRDEPLLTRDAFREGVFARDGHRCVICGAPAQDAHHVMERRLFGAAHQLGGYFMSNGVSVCGPHHLECERTTIPVEDVRAAAGIKVKVLPDHLYPDQPYDKWGNPVMPNGRRMRGELFHDASVQKALAEGGVLHLFTWKVKYPRTWHLPWSGDLGPDDRLIPDLSAFAGREVAIVEKLDGGNVTGLNPLCLDPGESAVHARSTDGRDPPGLDVARAVWAQIGHDVPAGWRVVMENLAVRHSIAYADLPGFLFGTSIWDDRNVMLGYDETLEWMALLGLPTPALLWRGTFDEAVARRLAATLDPERQEGYVMRTTGEIPYSGFRAMVGKVVREDHNRMIRHNLYGSQITKNHLSPGTNAFILA